MRNANISSVVFLVVFAGACDASPIEIRAHDASHDSSSIHDSCAICIASLKRARDCTSIYIPALVDARVRHDSPPGIAAADAEFGRAALLGEASAEWEIDSTDENIVANCEEMSESDIGISLDRCIDADTCESFVECVLPSFEESLSRKAI